MRPPDPITVDCTLKHSDTIAVLRRGIHAGVFAIAVLTAAAHAALMQAAAATVSFIVIVAPPCAISARGRRRGLSARNSAGCEALAHSVVCAAVVVVTIV